MSIPSVGGGDPNGLQRALMNAAEKLIADEAELADSTGKTSEKPAAATPGNQGQAMVVDLNDNAQPKVTVEGRWLTTAKPPAGTPTSTPQAAAQAPPAEAGQAKAAAAADMAQQPKTAGRTTTPMPAAPGQAAPSPSGLGSLQNPNSPRATAGPVSTGLTAPGAQTAAAAEAGSKSFTSKPVVTGSQAAIGTPTSINDHPTMQMLVMLKKSGVGFNDAMQVLKDLNPGVKLPPKEILKGFWNTLPAPKDGEVPLAKQPLDNLIRDAAWQKQNAAQQTTQSPAQQAQQASQLPAPRAGRPELQANDINYGDPRLVNSDPRAASVAGSPAHHVAANNAPALSPSLQTVVVNTQANQVYVAGLSTAEFQRLAAMLGANAPEWFWRVRNHHGLRGLFERPSFARLTTVRIAGVRMLFWLIAALGLILFWVIGARSGIWW